MQTGITYQLFLKTLFVFYVYPENGITTGSIFHQSYITYVFPSYKVIYLDPKQKYFLVVIL